MVFKYTVWKVENPETFFEKNNSKWVDIGILQTLYLLSCFGNEVGDVLWDTGDIDRLFEWVGVDVFEEYM